jgi:hypothetical protein
MFRAKLDPNHLSGLDWKKFEDFCILWLDVQNYEVTESHSPQGKLFLKNPPANTTGIGKIEASKRHIKGFYPNEGPKPHQAFVAICKNWDRPIPKSELKILNKIADLDEIPIIFALEGFDKEAVDYAQEYKIRLISNRELVETFNKQSTEKRQAIIAEIWDGKQHIPTCPICNIKMSKKEAQNEKRTKPVDINAPKFWYCKSFSYCHQRIIDKEHREICNNKKYKDFSLC